MTKTLALPSLRQTSILDTGRVAGLIESLRRDGIDVAVLRQVHEWDGATGTVTSLLTCIVDGRDIDGVGVARERGEASMRAILAAVEQA